jgi:hypothetical protein
MNQKYNDCGDSIFSKYWFQNRTLHAAPVAAEPSAAVRDAYTKGRNDGYTSGWNDGFDAATRRHEVQQTAPVAASEPRKLAPRVTEGMLRQQEKLSAEAINIGERLAAIRAALAAELPTL